MVKRWNIWRSEVLLLLVFFCPFSANASEVGLEAAWNSLPYLSQAEIETLPSITNFTQHFPLTIVRIKNSDWKTPELLQRIRRTEEVFSQCKISFRPIRLISVAHAKGPVLDLAEAETYFSIETLLERRLVTKPIIFLLNRSQDHGYEGGLALRAGNMGAEHPMVNTAYLFQDYAQSDSRSYSYSRPHRKSHYELMAHELGHLLFDRPHLPEEDNLMSVLSQRTNRIPAWQCKLIGTAPQEPGGSVSTF